MQRRVARPLRVVLVRDWSAEERHDAVARVLVHRALETVHSLGEQLEETVHRAMPILEIELLGELHRALHVGEEHGHLLALAFDGAAGGENLLREVGRGVGAGVGTGRRDGWRSSRSRQRRRALAAELEPGWILEPAGTALHG